MDQQGKKGIWNVFKKRSRKELDKMQRDLIFRPHEQRDHAGDPQQPKHQWVPLRHK